MTDEVNPDTGKAAQPAEAIVQRLTELGRTLAVAESLTGGLLAAAIVAVPGASEVFRGGVVTYATDAKADLLGVDPALLTRVGVVHYEVAEQMADGVRRLLGADVALATTGVAGPDAQDGQPPGTVFVAVADDAGSEARRLALPGDRQEVRTGAVREALRLLADRLQG